MINSALRLPVTLVILLPFLTGCASVSVNDIHTGGAAPKRLPTKIYVQEFVAPPVAFRVDRKDKELELFLKKERHSLAVDIVQQLDKYIAPAEILPANAPIPHGNFWLLQGKYVRVNQGSRLLRAGIGFGAGGTKMETVAHYSYLYKKSPQKFLSLFTTGGSGVAPGAWAAFTPALVFYWPSAVANAGGASLSGLSIDRTRTSREIVATLSEYCFQHGLISESHTRHPKRLGDLPPLQKPDFIVPKGGS